MFYLVFDKKIWYTRDLKIYDYERYYYVNHLGANMCLVDYSSSTLCGCESWVYTGVLLPWYNWFYTRNWAICKKTFLCLNCYRFSADRHSQVFWSGPIIYDRNCCDFRMCNISCFGGLSHHRISSKLSVKSKELLLWAQTK